MTTPNGTLVAHDAAAFPSDLLGRQQWLVWKFVQKPGHPKPSKMPYYASGSLRSGQQGSEQDRANLVDYAAAVEAMKRMNADGLGFAFLPGDGLIGIDLDAFLDCDDERRKKRGMGIIEACHSYTEYSPSGKGVHIIVKGDTETFKSNELGIEVFCGRQFFTMSGLPFPSTPLHIAEITPDTLTRLKKTVKKQAEQAPTLPVQQLPADQRTKLESALVFISADCGYDDWIAVGMAIQAELGDAGIEVWDWWSGRGSKYPGRREIESHYRSFKPGGRTAGTIYRMAMDAGWRPPKPVLAHANTQPPMIDGETGEILPPATVANDNDPVNAMATDWVFVAALRKFVHKPTMRLVDVDAFNLEHLHVMQYIPEVKKMKPAEYVRRIANCEVVHDLMYLPTMWNGDPMFTLDGIRYMNTYNDTCVPAADPNWQAHDAWRICLEHLQNILPNDWEQLLLWMAHNVQNPGKKVLWAPVIVGMPGDGKTTITKMLTAAMGRKHTQVVSNESLRSDFNGWAEGKCLSTFEEIRVPGHSRHDFMNKLKALITNDVVDVVAKGKNSKNIANTQNYIALSNYRDALVLDADDRRWGVFFTRFTSRQQVESETNKDYWDRLNDYAIRDNPTVLRGWLLSIDLTAFDRNQGPAMTEAKRYMISNSMSADAQSIDAVITTGAKGVSVNAIETKCLNMAIKDLENRTLQTSRMASALMELKFEKVPEPVKWDGRTCHIWIRKPMVYDGTSAARDRIRQELDRNQGNPPVNGFGFNSYSTARNPF